MNIKFASVAAAFLLASGCAQNGTVKPPAEPDVRAPVAAVTLPGAPSAGQTGDEVYASAVQAVRHY